MFDKLSQKQPSTLSCDSSYSGLTFPHPLFSYSDQVIEGLFVYSFELELMASGFFNEQFNLESENRFDLLAKGNETKSTETLTSKKTVLLVV